MSNTPTPRTDAQATGNSDPQQDEYIKSLRNQLGVYQDTLKSRDADRVYLDKQWNELRDHRDRLLELVRQSKDALWRARSDIWQTARVSEYNLTGKDPLFPNDRPNTPPDPPMTVTRAGVDQSYKVIEYIEETVKLLAVEFKEENETNPAAGSK